MNFHDAGEDQQRAKQHHHMLLKHMQRVLLVQLCCHPFLCAGLEEHIEERQRAAAKSGSAPDETARLLQASGKMVLLAKLLAKLQAEGHKARTCLPEARCRAQH